MDSQDLHWQDLVPGSLPTRCLKLTFRNVDLRRMLADFRFAGFARLEPGHSNRPLFDFARVQYYFDVHSVQKIRAEQNHYGPAFALEVGPDFLLLEDHFSGPEEEQRTVTHLLKHLTLERQLQCTWQAYSSDPDSGQISAVREGTEQELRALWFDPNQQAQWNGS